MKTSYRVLILRLLLVSVVCVFTVSTLKADNFEKDNITYTILSDSQVEVYGPSKPVARPPMGKISIPSKVTGDNGNTYKVVGIRGDAFYECKDITEVELPQGMEYIGMYAFSKCESLEKINLPSSLSYIGEKAFRDCSSLSEISIPQSITSIEGYIFSGCSKLNKIDLPESIDEIGYGAFYECSSLQTITLPENLSSLGNFAFSGCKSLVSIYIPSEVSTIDYSSFEGCSSLKEINVSSANQNLTSVSGILYSKDLKTLLLCPAGTVGVFEIPEGIEEIDSGAFSTCDKVTRVTIPETVTKIGDDAFSACGIYSIEIPASITKIGTSIFAGCKNLTEVKLPDNMTTITSWMFWGCTGLTEWIKDESITFIGNFAFFGCTGLTQITFQDSLKEIGRDVFNSCTGLRQIDIPGSVSILGNGVFEGCKNIERLIVRRYAPPRAYQTTWDEETLNKATLYVPAEALELYREDPAWNCFRNIETLEHLAGVGEVEMEGEDIPQTVFDLSGRVVPHNATQEDINSLPSGVYIIGSKKVLIP